MTQDTAVAALYPSAVEADGILNALESAIVVVDASNRIVFLNSQGEQFFSASAGQLFGTPLQSLMPVDSPVFGIIELVREEGAAVSEYGLTLESPKINKHFVNVQAGRLSDQPDHVVLAFFERSIADKIERQLVHRNSARSVTAMAAMLAHEVKNPLSGIRGAAQLLEENTDPEDKNLTRLICDETDRITALVDRMEVFSDQRPLERTAVNIHQVLERVISLAQTGFASHLKIREIYDPSLPLVDGNFDQLVQIFLNLVKNAAEAAPEKGGEIVVTTAYQHSVKFAVPGLATTTNLPLVITIQDNGDGIPEDLQDHLFDAFVSGKPKGSGLGLALVAKMVDDHGGVIEFESAPGRTVFKIMLAMAPAGEERSDE